MFKHLITNKNNSPRLCVFVPLRETISFSPWGQKLYYEEGQKLTLRGPKLTPCGTETDPLILHVLMRFVMVKFLFRLHITKTTENAFSKARYGGPKLYCGSVAGLGEAFLWGADFFNNRSLLKNKLSEFGFLLD